MVMITWKDNCPIEKELMHKLLSKNESNYMVFLQLKSQLPAILFFFLFSQLFQTLLTKDNNAELIQNYIIAECIYMYLLGFVYSSRILSFEHANSLFTLFLNKCSLTNKRMLFDLSSKYMSQ